MTISGWVRLDRWMRALHLYTSMLLVPWMLVYAISGFCVNHNEWFGEKLQLQPKWKVLQEVDFEPNVEFPQNDNEQAQAILKHLNLEGAYQVAGDDPSQLVIYRYCATGLYRINWQRQPSRLVVQKQLPCSFYSFVNALHFQRGILSAVSGQPSLADLGNRRGRSHDVHSAVGDHRHLPLGAATSAPTLGRIVPGRGNCALRGLGRPHEPLSDRARRHVVRSRHVVTSLAPHAWESSATLAPLAMDRLMRAK